MLDNQEGMWNQSGWATYAAIMLFGGGLVGIVNGIWALRYDTTEADLVIAERSLEVWGAGALLGGVAMIVISIGVFNGKLWARWLGIVIAILAIVWNVGWAQIQAVQALIGALIYISVVFALATHPVTTERQPWVEPSEGQR